eukprot:jgi/Tetstr1/446053/TSEL_033655.t1
MWATVALTIVPLHRRDAPPDGGAARPARRAPWLATRRRPQRKPPRRPGCLPRAGWSDPAAASILGAHAAPAATPATESASATVQAAAGAIPRRAGPLSCSLECRGGESIEAGEAARAPVVPAAPVADSGLDDRLTALAYVGASGAAAAGGLGLGWVASGALPLDGAAAGDAPASRDAPGLPDVLDDVLGDGGDPGSMARYAAPSAEGADIARRPNGYKRPATSRA